LSLYAPSFQRLAFGAKYFYFYLGPAASKLAAGLNLMRVSTLIDISSQSDTIVAVGFNLPKWACGGFAALKMAFCLDSPLG